jgi:hypothetical protein
MAGQTENLNIYESDRQFDVIDSESAQRHSYSCNMMRINTEDSDDAQVKNWDVVKLSFDGELVYNHMDSEPLSLRMIH